MPTDRSKGSRCSNSEGKDKDNSKPKKKTYTNKKRRDSVVHKDAKEGKNSNNDTANIHASHSLKEFTFKKPIDIESETAHKSNNNANRNVNTSIKKKMCHMGMQTMKPLIVEIDKIFGKQDYSIEEQKNDCSKTDLNWSHFDRWDGGFDHHASYNTNTDNNDNDNISNDDSGKERKWSQTSTICIGAQFDGEDSFTSSPDLIELELEIHDCKLELQEIGQSLLELTKLTDLTQ